MIINIEIHGLPDIERIKRIRSKIFWVFDEIYGGEGFVVTICEDSVVDSYIGTPGCIRTGNIEGRQPFFRVYYTSEDELELISDKLRPFNFHLEAVLLKKFIHRRDYGQNPDNRLEVAAETKYEDTYEY